MSNPVTLRRARMRAALILAAGLFLAGVTLGLLWVNLYAVR